MNAEEIAQWVINNRYPRSEQDKMSDAEMYCSIVEAINNLIDNREVAIKSHDWVSLEVIERVKSLWNTENVNHENPRVQAIKLIIAEAKELGREDVDLRKAHEIVKKIIGIE